MGNIRASNGFVVELDGKTQREERVKVVLESRWVR